MPNTLTITFTAASPAPANGYRVKYWNTNTPGTINTVSPNPTSSPVSISGLIAGCYSGTIEASCGGAQFSSPVSFNACSGTTYCVLVTSESFTEASTECPGVNDAYTVYTFTLKNFTGSTTVNAPSNVNITFDGWTNYPGGASAYNGNAIILSGNSSTTATVYTSQALNGAPGCPCPCATTVTIDSNSFAATISSPNTVSICPGSGGSGGSGGGSGGSGGGSGGSGGGSGGGGGVSTYDCVNGNCVATVGGGYSSLVECQQSGCGGSGGGGSQDQIT